MEILGSLVVAFTAIAIIVLPSRLFSRLSNEALRYVLTTTLYVITVVSYGNIVDISGLMDLTLLVLAMGLPSIVKLGQDQRGPHDSNPEA